jgi:hypothetical protein
LGTQRHPPKTPATTPASISGKSEQPRYLSVDADGIPSWVDQITFAVTEDDAGKVVVVLGSELIAAKDAVLPERLCLLVAEG